MMYLSVDVEEDFPPHLKSFKGFEGLKRIVGLIREYGCDATFFVTAEMVERKPEIVDLLKGFEVGCHGLRHVDYTKVPLAEFERDLSCAVDILKSHAIKPTGFRAPYARISEGMLKAVGRHFVYDSSKRFNEVGFLDVEEVPIYTGGKAFGIRPSLFGILLKLPLGNKVFFIHPWEYGGLEFVEIASRRRGMGVFGYSQGNYLLNLRFLLSLGTRRLSELV